MSKPKLNIKKVLFTTLWVAIAVAGIVLLQAAVHSQNVKECKGVEVDISGVNNNFFIDKADVIAIIKNFVGGNPTGRSMQSFDLRAIELNLEQDVWIKNAELFFDNNDVLQVNVDEREPAARLFSVDGNTFYIDSSLKILPLSEKFSARLPVFTGFPHSSNIAMKAADSSLLKDVLNISEKLLADSFLMAMVDQVDITPQRSFEMIPKIGNQTIVFGDAVDVDEKFNKLKLFYKKVITTAGFNRYSVINLQYKDQVVAKIKGAEDKTADSLRTLQIMQMIAERSAELAADSVHTFSQDSEKNTTDSTLIQESMEREEPELGTMPGAVETEENSIDGNTVSTGAAIVKPTVVKPVVTKPVAAKPAAAKPVAKPAVKPVAKPAAVKPKPAVVKPKPAATKPSTTKPKAKVVMPKKT